MNSLTRELTKLKQNRKNPYPINCLPVTCLQYLAETEALSTSKLVPTEFLPHERRCASLAPKLSTCLLQLSGCPQVRGLPPIDFCTRDLDSGVFFSLSHILSSTLKLRTNIDGTG